MILGPISLIDCLVFVLFLAPQLLLQVRLYDTVACILQVLPFLRKSFSTRLGESKSVWSFSGPTLHDGRATRPC